MTSSVGIVSNSQSSVAFARASVAAPAASTPTSASAAAQTNSQTTVSPRIVVDPFAGVITEFLNSSGQVQLQIPSAAAVAYLRVGLTADGDAKPGVTPKPEQHTGQTSVA